MPHRHSLSTRSKLVIEENSFLNIIPQSRFHRKVLRSRTQRVRERAIHVHRHKIGFGNKEHYSTLNFEVMQVRQLLSRYHIDFYGYINPKSTQFNSCHVNQKGTLFHLNYTFFFFFKDTSKPNYQVQEEYIDF